MSFRPRFFRSVRQLSQNFGAFRLAEPQAQKLLFSLQIHADRHVHRVLRHAAIVAAHMHDDAVEIDDGPDRIEPPLRQAVTSASRSAVISETSVGDTSTP